MFGSRASSVPRVMSMQGSSILQGLSGLSQIINDMRDEGRQRQQDPNRQYIMGQQLPFSGSAVRLGGEQLPPFQARQNFMAAKALFALLMDSIERQPAYIQNNFDSANQAQEKEDFKNQIRYANLQNIDQDELRRLINHYFRTSLVVQNQQDAMTKQYAIKPQIYTLLMQAADAPQDSVEQRTALSKLTTELAASPILNAQWVLRVLLRQRAFGEVHGGREIPLSKFAKLRTRAARVLKAVYDIRKFAEKPKLNAKRDTKSARANMIQLLSKQPRLNIKAGKAAAFPQWALSTQRKTDKVARKKTYQSVAQALDNPRNETLLALNKIAPDQAYWDPVSLSWQGNRVAKWAKKQVRGSVALDKKLKRSNKLLDAQLSPQEAATMVPPIVQSIIDANENLSSVGFGKISKNSSALYAGRWLDYATGRIRQLPPASKKYLNPLSLNQMKGFLQASILNSWNKIVSTNTRLAKLNEETMTAQSYADTKRQQIEKQLSKAYDMYRFNEKISEWILESFNQVISYNDPKFLILQKITQEKLKEIYNMPSPMLSEDAAKQSQTYPFSQEQIDEMKARIEEWITTIQQSFNSLSRSVQRSDQGPYEKAKHIENLAKAARNFTASNKAIQSAYLRVAKTALVPQNMDPKQMIDIVQDFDQLKEGMDRVWRRNIGHGLSTELLQGQVGRRVQALPATLLKIPNTLAQVQRGALTNYTDSLAQLYGTGKQFLAARAPPRKPEKLGLVLAKRSNRLRNMLEDPNLQSRFM